MVAEGRARTTTLPDNLLEHVILHEVRGSQWRASSVERLEDLLRWLVLRQRDDDELESLGEG